jgi:phosphoribosylformylglycinamidine synthase
VSGRTCVVVFPGSNCDRDAQRAIERVGGECDLVWHTTDDLDAYDAIVLPGGFSYGDYLRCGAIARTSPVMQAVIRAAERGTFVLGICNGFQILTEAGLLPGALVRNRQQRFVCDTVELDVASSKSPMLESWIVGDRVRIPIAHGEGCYVCDDDTLVQLVAEERIAFRYADRASVNGSRDGIAGVIGGPNHNVLGMMPHPERAVDPWMDSQDGATLLQALIEEVAHAPACA